MSRSRDGFTLIELLIVFGVIGVLTSIVLVAINPGKQLCVARNAGRKTTVREIGNALQQYAIREWQSPIAPFPLGVENAKPVCRSGITGDATCISLAVLVPDYLVALPVDAQEEDIRYTGYAAYRDDSGHDFIVALNMEECSSDTPSSSGGNSTSGNSTSGNSGSGSTNSEESSNSSTLSSSSQSSVTADCGAASDPPAAEYSDVGARLFDFNANTAVTQSGFTGVSVNTVYSATVGYGWDSAIVSSGYWYQGYFDRNTPTALLRDGHASSLTHTFSVDVANGAYEVTVIMGDASFARDRMEIALEGIVQGELASAAGKFAHVTYTATVTDGQLNIRFAEKGGDPYWVLNGILVRPTSSVGTLMLAGPIGCSEADGTTADTYTVAGAPPNATILLGTSRGTFVGAGTTSYSPYSAQVQADGNGAFTFQLRRATRAESPVTITAKDEWGRIKGSWQRTFLVPEVRRFDFNANNAVTESGFTGVSVNTVYSVSNGYGWDAALVAAGSSNQGYFDRSTPTALKRDGHWGAPDHTFTIQVKPNVPYGIRTYIGDNSFARNNIQIFVNGTLQFTVSTAAGAFDARTFTAVSPTGELAIRIHDNGGDPYWVLNGIDCAEGGESALPAAP